ncbi:MAG: stalk domain-containing protein [Candidatus Ornithomonoglobus sp.]
MRKKLSMLCSLMLTAQMILSLIVTPVFAEDEVYTVPESAHQTYNMNLDWKFYDAGTDAEIWTAMSTADKNGKKFYEKDYDDSEWESVSIPHAPAGLTAFKNNITDGSGSYLRDVLLYRKTFTVPTSATGKVFFELEGIRQAAYVWVNGEAVGYYEAGITAMGFDITKYITPGETAVIAILNDGTLARNTTGRIPFETVPGEKWGSSYTPDNYKTIVGNGAAFQWNTTDFNEAQIGLVYDAYLHVTSDVYQTFPLYNNLKTTGNYIYADNFNIRAKKATLNVKAEIRNESAADGSYTLEVAVVDHEGKLKYNFTSQSVEVKKASDAGVVYETAVESEVYGDAAGNGVGLTKVNTPDVTYITASYDASDVRFWSTDDPYLYTVYTILRDSNGNAVDVQKKDTGFRKVSYDKDNGVLINDKAVWLTGYAQRSTNEWAVIGIAPDWLQDYDMALLKENNANFIRWMHVAPKPAEVRSSDKYGVAIACPAGDKEGTAPDGRQWSQRTEAMRDAMIYYRNSPSVLFWETGNSPMGTQAKAEEMANLRDTIDPKGMRFIGARSTESANELNYDYNYAGTMCAGPETAPSAMAQNGKYGPIMETEYARDEAPRRVWDDYSPPDYDYVNKYISSGGKEDGYDVWDHTQESITVANVKDYGSNFYANRAGQGKSMYSAAAMMVWSDSNMHGRNSGTENDRTSGRVDAVRQTKEMFEGTKTAFSSGADVHIIGHWSYPAVSDDTYNYFLTTDAATAKGQTYQAYTTEKAKRDPTKKTVYAIGSAQVKKIELYRVDGNTETLIGTDDTADSGFVYQFDNIDVTKGDAVIAKAYNARGELITTDEIQRTYDAAGITLEAVTSPDGWRADGSDIAYIDVKVVDKNGNVCALNYDKIEFEYSGDGVYLGGYNSGMGTNCFQNTAASEGISHYFGGVKDGISTIGKNYVYAENGTNRIFVRSTRTAGEFTLTAKMGNITSEPVKITSKSVSNENGLTTLMQSGITPEVGEPPAENTVTALKPLMLAKKDIDWSKVKIEKEIDTNVYYIIKVNDEELTVADGARARLGTMNKVFGPILPILDKIGYQYNYDEASRTLSFANGSNNYVVTVGSNEIVINGTDRTEIIQEPQIIGDTLFVSLAAVLSYAGVGVIQDDENKVVNIKYNAN